MSSRVVYMSATALLLVIAGIWPASTWFESEVGDTSLHGPIAFVVVLPLVGVAALGSLALAIAVARNRLATIPLAAFTLVVVAG